MATGFVDRIKAFVTSPSKAFEKEHKTTLKEAMIYGFKGFLILSLLLGVMAGLTPVGTLGLLTIPVMFILILVAGFFGLLVGALWYHLWAYIFGARQGYKNTIKILFFAETPTYILGWIPFVNFIAGIWSIILVGVGLKKLQKLSTGRAVAVILMSIIIPLAIFAILILWAIANYGPIISAANETTSAFSFPY